LSTGLPLHYLSVDLLGKQMVVDLVWLLASDWSISVKTGPDPNMSLSVTVAVRAYGSHSITDLVTLGSGEDGIHFRQNAVDEFKVGTKTQINDETLKERTLLLRTVTADTNEY